MGPVRTVEGLVISDSPQNYAYFVHIDTQFDDLEIKLNYNFCPQGINLIGKWLEIKLDKYIRPCEQVVVLEDRFETRFDDHGHPEVKVKLKYHSRLANRYEMYYSSSFGFVCEPYIVIEQPQEGSWFYVWISRRRPDDVKAHWKISKLQDSVDPIDAPSEPMLNMPTDVPLSKPAACGKRSDKLRVVTGIIRWYTKDELSYSAWSNSMPDSPITIPISIQPMNLHGKWAEMAIDERNFVREPVNIIPDVFETRIRRGLLEIRVHMQHIESHHGSFEMFKNDYFGNIADTRNVINARIGAWYTAWIISHKQPGVNAHWRLSIDQCYDGPFNQNPQNDDNERKQTHEDELVVLKGIVTGVASNDRGYLAVGLGRVGTTICVNYEFCPQNTDLMGRWIEMQVDRKNKVQRPVLLIHDVYPTRMTRGRPEIRCSFRHISTGRNVVFSNDDLGDVVDILGVMSSVEQGEWYEAWLEIHLARGSFLWRIATYGDVYGPLKGNDRRICDNTSKSRRSSPNHRSSSLRSHDDYSRRSVSPEQRSRYGDEHGQRRSPERRRQSRSPPRRERRRSVSVDERSDRSSHRSDCYQNARPKTPPLPDDPRSLRRFDDLSKNLKCSTSQSDHGEGTSSRSGSTSAKPSESLTSQNPPYKPWNPHAKAQKMREKIRGVETKSPIHSEHSHQESATREELRRLRMNLSQLVRIADFYTSNPEIVELLRKIDLDAYEQLLRELQNARNKFI